MDWLIRQLHREKAKTTFTVEITDPRDGVSNKIRVEASGFGEVLLNDPLLETLKVNAPCDITIRSGVSGEFFMYHVGRVSLANGQWGISFDPKD